MSLVVRITQLRSVNGAGKSRSIHQRVEDVVIAGENLISSVRSTIKKVLYGHENLVSAVPMDSIHEYILERSLMMKPSEQTFWEQSIKDEAIRVGIDPTGTIGCATLHLIGEKAQLADIREAGSREHVLPATEGAESPLDQPVTGSASQSAYHRKLAEAMVDAEQAELKELHPKLYAMWQNLSRKGAVERVTAVLASEKVVDPGQYKSLAVWATEAEELLAESRAKVERLEAELDSRRRITGEALHQKNAKIERLEAEVKHLKAILSFKRSSDA